MKTDAIVIPIVPEIAAKRILFATDFSEVSLSALPLVSTIARKYESRVFVVNVWTPVPYTMISPEAAGVLQRQDEREIQAKTRKLLNTKELTGLSATALVMPGIPAQELSRLVREENIDLAILATHGRTGLRHLLMGSVAEELFRNLPCRCSRWDPISQSVRSQELKSSTSCFPPIFPTSPGRSFPTWLRWRQTIKRP